MLRIVFCASGGGHLIHHVLQTFANDGRIQFQGLVGDDQAEGSCHYAEEAGVPVTRVSRRDAPDLGDFNQELYSAIHPWEPELIICTFNHLITMPTIGTWPDRISSPASFAAGDRKMKSRYSEIRSQFRKSSK